MRGSLSRLYCKCRNIPGSVQCRRWSDQLSQSLALCYAANTRLLSESIGVLRENYGVLRENYGVLRGTMGVLRRNNDVQSYVKWRRAAWEGRRAESHFSDVSGRIGIDAWNWPRNRVVEIMSYNMVEIELKSYALLLNYNTIIIIYLIIIYSASVIYVMCKVFLQNIHTTLQIPAHFESLLSLFIQLIARYNIFSRERYSFILRHTRIHRLMLNNLTIGETVHETCMAWENIFIHACSHRL